jgi:hypothetical protein
MTTATFAADCADAVAAAAADARTTAASERNFTIDIRTLRYQATRAAPPGAVS